MRLLIFLLSIGFTSPELKVDRLPSSSSPYSACDPRIVSAGINGDFKVPSEKIYHYGKKEILLKDVAEGTVPKQDWEDFIMGEKTRFKLKRYRRGLYGTEYVEDADKFGDSNYNWLMEVRLKKSCLKPERVSSLIYLPWSKRFKKWFGVKRENLNFVEWVNTCFHDNAHPKPAYFNEYRNPKENADYSESVCERTVADYYHELDFAFIQDAAGDLVRSWYIRDRNCIETIEGTDHHWAKEFSLNEELWKNTCDATRNHRNNVRVWFTALANVGYRIEELDRFSKMIRSIKEPDSRVDWETDEEDRFAAQDFAFTLERVARRCQKSNHDDLREVLRGIALNVDHLESSDVKVTLESACR